MVPVVTEDSNGNSVFPPEIPSKRDNRDIPPRVLFITLLLACGVICTNYQISLYIFGTFFSFNLLLILLELLNRIYYLFEEFHHIKSRHKDSVLLLLMFVFKTNLYTFLTLIISSISYYIVTFLSNFNLFQESYSAIIITFISSYFFVKIIDIEESPMRFVKQLDDLRGMDYGSGLAYSYYNGYLNIILPETGDERKGLKELIIQYESENNIEIPIKKMFILIPMSGFCPPKVGPSKMEIELAKKLESRVLNRAGTRDRVYHATVYKIWENQRIRPKYVCVEFATPLLTFYELLQLNLPGVENYQKYQREIATNFYIALKKLVKNNRNMRDLCEIIYYKDTDINGDPDKNLDVGTLLLERLRPVL